MRSGGGGAQIEKRRLMKYDSGSAANAPPLSPAALVADTVGVTGSGDGGKIRLVSVGAGASSC